MTQACRHPQCHVNFRGSVINEIVVLLRASPCVGLQVDTLSAWHLHDACQELENSVVNNSIAHLMSRYHAACVIKFRFEKYLPECLCRRYRIKNVLKGRGKMRVTGNEVVTFDSDHFCPGKLDWVGFFGELFPTF